jgi:hypothetical protein
VEPTFPLYEKLTPYIIGFHGCDQSVADMLLNSDQPTFKKSTNDYDWLGSGMYFWENDPNRAWKYIHEAQKREPKRIKNPTVIGAVLDLGHCLNLVENRYITLLKNIYEAFKVATEINNAQMPENKGAYSEDHDKLKRHLDCAVIEFLHAHLKTKGTGQDFDSVRGMFIEGGAVYEGAGFHEKTHVQIAIRNPNMIKGYFRPITCHREVE